MRLYYSLGGVTVLYGMYGTPYTTQNHTMIFFKLLIKLYTTVLLALTLLSSPFSSSTMANLDVTGNAFASIRIRFANEHNVPAFHWVPKLLIDQYDYWMPLDLYKTLFEDATTCVKLILDAFTILNDLFCKFIQAKSSHADASSEARAI